MSDLKLARVEPVPISTEAARWNHQPGRNPQQRRRPPPAARAKLITAVVPGGDPESCEVEYVVDAAGMLLSLVVRDVASGAELARIAPQQLAILAGEGAQSGLLFERQG